MSNRILVVTQQGEARFLTTETAPTRVITIQPTGARGATGANGVGVPTGGSTNDILKKTSSSNYDTEWETPTALASPDTIVRRDETGGAFFGGDVAAPKFLGPYFQASNASAGASLRDSADTVYLTWGATAGNISITVDTTSTGHFFSNPSTATAGHFITKNGTTPTIAAGRSAWFSSTTGDPQFKNGTSSAVTLIYSGSALGTPASGTLTNCTGLPVSTGISGLGTGIATFLATPSSANLIAAVTDETGDGDLVTNANPTIYDIYLEDRVNFNATTYTYGIGAASAHRTALGLTSLATTTPGTGVATFLATPSSANLRLAVTDETGTGSLVFATAPSVTNLTTDQLTLSGNISSAAWTTNGLRIKGVAATLTDTTSTGTVAAAYTDAFGGNTIAATNSTTFTNYTTAFFREPTAGTNVVMTNKWAIGAESARIGTSNQLTISTSGVLTATSPVFTTPALGTPSALVVTNATGTASININGTVGATTANTGAFTTITASSTITGATHNGGTAANDDLTLQGTTNATRTTSYVLIQPNGGFTGIGTSAPALPLHIVNSNANAGMFRAQNTSASGYTGFELYGDAGTQLAAFGTGNSTTAFYPGEMYLGTNTAKAVNIYTTNSSSVRMYISAAGGVSVGNTTDAGATNLSVTGRITGTAGIVYGTFTVSTFPSTTYLEAVVTDALAPVVGATVAAGGSAKCKVMYNGSAKIVTAVL